MRHAHVPTAKRAADTSFYYLIDIYSNSNGALALALKKRDEKAYNFGG